MCVCVSIYIYIYIYIKSNNYKRKWLEISKRWKDWTKIFAKVPFERYQRFEENISICLIDKTGHSNPQKREYYWMRTLKIISHFGLNQAYSSSSLRAIIAWNHLPFSKRYLNFVHFWPNFQIFCPFLSFACPFSENRTHTLTFRTSPVNAEETYWAIYTITDFSSVLLVYIIAESM